MTVQSFEIGTSTAAMVNVETVLLAGSSTKQIKPPKSTLTLYSQPVELADGLRRGAGWTAATWTWESLENTERDKLRAYCTGASTNIYIKTRGVETTDAFVTYSGVMIWPQTEERETGPHFNRRAFTVECRKLIAV